MHRVIVVSLLILAYVVGMVLLIVLFAPDVRAGTIERNAENCIFTARVSSQMAEFRDMGMPLADMRMTISEQVKEAKGQPGSLIQDQDDANYVMRLVERVYGEYKDKKPSEIEAYVMMSCMKGAEKQKMQGKRVKLV